jgi:hypothetical protein
VTKQRQPVQRSVAHDKPKGTCPPDTPEALPFDDKRTATPPHRKGLETMTRIITKQGIIIDDPHYGESGERINTKDVYADARHGCLHVTMRTNKRTLFAKGSTLAELFETARNEGMLTCDVTPGVDPNSAEAFGCTDFELARRFKRLANDVQRATFQIGIITTLNDNPQTCYYYDENEHRFTTEDDTTGHRLRLTQNYYGRRVSKQSLIKDTQHRYRQMLRKLIQPYKDARYTLRVRLTKKHTDDKKAPATGCTALTFNSANIENIKPYFQYGSAQRLAYTIEDGTILFAAMNGPKRDPDILEEITYPDYVRTRLKRKWHALDNIYDGRFRTEYRTGSDEEIENLLDEIRDKIEIELIDRIESELESMTPSTTTMNALRNACKANDEPARKAAATLLSFFEKQTPTNK